MCSGKIPDYQHLKANSFYEVNKEWLGWAETGLKIGVAVVIILAGKVATFEAGTMADIPEGLDDGSHLIASMFGGSGDNLLAMNRQVNRKVAVWYEMEQSWKKALEDIPH